MKNLINLPLLVNLSLLFIFTALTTTDSRAAHPSWLKDSMSRLEKELLTKYGEIRKDQLIRGMKQVGDFWREEDGDAAAFEDFVRGNFAGDEKVRDAIFTRFQSLLEKIDGSMHEIDIALDRQTDLNLGPIYPFDRVFASYGVSAHIMDDFFTNKLAFVVLLNFPQTTLEQRLNEGEKWTRRQWAEARLVQRFSKRIPASVNLALARAGSASDQYIADYNIWMYHLLDNDGERLFPPRLRLLSHWNLRDELKANYENSKNGLAKQRMIIKVMERIVDQTIPAVVINNPHVDWNPYTNKLTAAAVSDSDEDPAADMRISDDPEPDTRYRIWLDDFLASRMVDEYSPTAPTLIERRFNEDREIPEERVREMFEQVCGSPLAARVAQVIRKRLGRDLEPLDLWYNGFRSTGKYTEAELDKIVSEKYPTPRAYKDDMPRFLRLLGFPGEKADQIAGNILVEAARGSGHASGGEMRGQPARLRTRVNRDGMDYKGFNIAVHEMGHNVEQTISMNFIDHTLLGGVPNTAFTEAFAFVFQENDLMLLGLDPQEDEQSEALKALNDFWMTMEISAVSLVDMEAWHWLYDHPQATAAQFKKALIKIAKDVWNRYYASLLGKKDVYLLGIYSHMIHSFLYLPDYPIGHLISVQVREQMQKAGNIGVEFERMALQGNIAPDLWMKGATGSPVGAEAMLEATEKALWVLE